MPSHALLRAAQAAVPVTPTDTYTDELRARVAGLHSLPASAHERLNGQIDTLEREISKEAASARIDREMAGDD